MCMLDACQPELVFLRSFGNQLSHPQVQPSLPVFKTLPICLAALANPGYMHADTQLPA
jgi:hypothetical protein